MDNPQLVVILVVGASLTFTLSIGFCLFLYFNGFHVLMKQMDKSRIKAQHRESGSNSSTNPTKPLVWNEWVLNKICFCKLQIICSDSWRVNWRSNCWHCCYCVTVSVLTKILSKSWDLYMWLKFIGWLDITGWYWTLKSSIAVLDG